MKRISYRAKSLAVASRKRAECQSRDEVEKQSTRYREIRNRARIPVISDLSIERFQQAFSFRTGKTTHVLRVMISGAIKSIFFLDAQWIFLEKNEFNNTFSCG